MRKTKRMMAAGAAVALGLLGAVPAAAQTAQTDSRTNSPARATVAQDADVARAVTKVSGSRSCGPSDQVYVRVTLDGFGTAGIIYGSNGAQAQQGTDLIFRLGMRTANWTVSAPVGISTVNDGCTSM